MFASYCLFGSGSKFHFAWLAAMGTGDVSSITKRQAMQADIIDICNSIESHSVLQEACGPKNMSKQFDLYTRSTLCLGLTVLLRKKADFFLADSRALSINVLPTTPRTVPVKRSKPNQDQEDDEVGDQHMLRKRKRHEPDPLADPRMRNLFTMPEDPAPTQPDWFNPDDYFGDETVGPLQNQSSMFFVEPAIPNEPPIEVQDRPQNQQDPQEEPRSNPSNPNETQEDPGPLLQKIPAQQPNPLVTTPKPPRRTRKLIDHDIAISYASYTIRFIEEIKEAIRDWGDITCRDTQEQDAEFLAQNRLRMDRQHDRQLEEALDLPANTTNGFSNGQIVYLTLMDFKSYGGTVAVGDFEEFTVISGRNGSGKSNLLDAIRFVLNERLSKKDRGLNPQFLIHGSNCGKPSADRCAVELLFQLPDGQRTTFRREYRKTGCTYEVDGRRMASSEDYTKQLEEAGIHLNAKHFVVQQGKISQVATMKPKERADLFQRICGSQKLRKEDEKLQAELLEKQQMKDKLFEKSKFVNKVANEKRKIRDSLEMLNKERKQLNHLSVQLCLFKLLAKDKAIEKVQQKMDDYAAAITAIETSMTDADMNIVELQEQLKETALLIRNKRKIVETKEMEAITLKHAKAILNVKMQEKSIKEKEIEREGLEREKWNVDEEVETINKKINELKEQMDAMESAMSQSDSSNLQLSQISLKEYRQLERAFLEKAAPLIANRELLQTQLDKAAVIATNHENAAKRLEQNERSAKENKAILEQKIKDLNNRKAKVEEILNETLIERDNNEENLAKLKNDDKKKLNELQKLNASLREFSIQQEYSRRSNRKEKVVERLRIFFPGKIFGRVSDFIELSSRKYSLAVTRTVGSLWDAIICDSLSVGEEAIKYLTKNRFDRETFIPVAVENVTPSLNQLRAMAAALDKRPNEICPVYDLLNLDKIDSKIKGVLHHICGLNVFVDDENDARQLSIGQLMANGKRYNAVCLNGTMYSRNGMIKGGRRDLESRMRQISEKDIEQKRSKKAELEVDVSKLRRDMRDIEMELPRLNATIQAERKRLESLEKTIDGLKEDKQKMEDELREAGENILAARNSLERAKEEADKVRKDFAANKKKIAEKQDQIFEQFCQKHGLNSIRQYQDGYLLMMTSCEDEHNRLEAQMTNYKAELKLAKESAKNLQKKIDTIGKVLKEKHAKLTKLEKKKDEEVKKRKAMEEEVKKMKKLIGEHEKDIDKYNAEIAVCKKNRQKLRNDKMTAERKKERARNERTSLSFERSQLIHLSRLDGFDLPLSQGGFVDISANYSEILSQATSDTEVDKSVAEEIVNTYTPLHPDYDQLDEIYQAMDMNSEKKVQKKMQEMEDRLTEARDKIDRFGATMTVEHAKKEWKEAMKAKKEADATYKKALDELVEADMKSKRLKAERQKMFDDYFSAVSRKLDRTYKETWCSHSLLQLLTMSSSASAALLSGVSFHDREGDGVVHLGVVPPGKRWMSVEQLSGAEKAVISLALLLAMQATKSSPFIVLDEIDASFDNTNVGKLLSYIRTMCSEKQLIVTSHKEKVIEEAAANFRISNAGDIGNISSTVQVVINHNFTRLVPPTFSLLDSMEDSSEDGGYVSDSIGSSHSPSDVSTTAPAHLHRHQRRQSNSSSDESHKPLAAPLAAARRPSQQKKAKDREARRQLQERGDGDQAQQPQSTRRPIPPAAGRLRIILSDVSFNEI
ncbi:hypothetical protein WR25_04179 [Diploscapter pachys]|uniref:SMC hinge domain-containing protein n=1 Tax=Diploscapter pachys TaxID=2018661 RepID=A0A2A2LGE8_9BILA|nr:hypothetical protein WR25_04179 [Diploscapter pachys]